MGLSRMVNLAFRAWPFIRPLLAHLILLLALFGTTMGAGILGAFIGTDLFTNKVLIGEKLQPLQAHLLLLGEEYVTTDPDQLGQGKSYSSGQNEKAAFDSNAELELTRDQRRTVRNRLLIWGAIGAVFGAIFGFGSYYYSVWIWQSVNQNLRVAMVSRAETLPIQFHDDARVGDSVFRVYQDSAMIVNLIQSAVLAPIWSLGTLFWGLVVLLAFDPWLMVIGALTTGFMSFVAGLTTGRIRKRALFNRIANSDLVSNSQEAFTSAKLVKANGAEESMCQRFVQGSDSALNAAYFLRFDMVLITLVVSLIVGAGVIFADYLMARWAILEQSTFGFAGILAALVGFAIWNAGAYQVGSTTFEALGWESRGLLGTWMRMQDLFVALDRAYYLLEIQDEVEDPKQPLTVPEDIKEVSWHSVGFAYKASEPILTHVNLRARKGTVTAIVGSTGTGKSTLMSLLLRLFDVDSGSVQINGIDIRQFKRADLRKHVAIALQKNVLFADTIANNISFGAKGAMQEDIERAAALATADEFIKELPNGLATELGERGGKLSSGQRQRLSIARAVVRGSPILILDEPTASLDAKTEAKVLANLADWGKNRLIFLITHRIATIKRADQIAFIEDGEVVELGSHEELVHLPNGRYRAMIEAEAELAAA